MRPTVRLAGDVMKSNAEHITNGSLIDTIGTNERKSQILSSFASRYGLCIPHTDFEISGEQYTFVQKKTNIDYVLFDKIVLKLLDRYETYEDDFFLLTSGHLPIIAKFTLGFMHCHQLRDSQIKPSMTQGYS